PGSARVGDQRAARGPPRRPGGRHRVGDPGRGPRDLAPLRHPAHLRQPDRDTRRGCELGAARTHTDPVDVDTGAPPRARAARARPSNVGAGPAFVAAGMLPGPYRFDVAGASYRAVLTNKTPSGAYRGFGMQQATWVRERLVDEAARELGIDRIELRLRNMIGPE